MADSELRKKQLTEQREEQILKAALEVFARKGYGAASIPEIAEVAGVAVGTIYNYYPSKRELFIAVMKNLIITYPSLNIKEAILKADIADVFKQVMKNRLELTEAEPGSRIPYLMSEIVRDTELKALWVEQSIEPLFTQMEEIYRAMMTSGRLRPIEPSVAIRAVASMVIGFNMVKFLEGEKSPLKQLSQESLAVMLTDFILHGLAANSNDKNI